MRSPAVVSMSNSQPNAKGPEIRAEVVLTGENARREFEALEAKKAELESKVGFPLIWHSPEDKNMRRIYAQQDADFLNEGLWPKHFAWLKEKLEAMHKVFNPVVRSL